MMFGDTFQAEPRDVVSLKADMLNVGIDVR